MKKLLVAAIGVATAVGAFADTISTKRFEEGTTVGNVETISSLNTLAGGTDFWSDGSAISNAYKIGAVDALGGIVSQPTPLGTPTKALDVATRFGEPLNLNIQDGGTTTNIPNSGLYFDSLVKFTVCDGDPDEAYYGQGGAYEGAKIVMWLKSEDDINTNLMVRAGYLSYDNGVKVTNKTYTCTVPSGFDASGFNRVTIKAISDITAGGLKVPAFAIYINGKTDGTQARLVSCNEAKWDNTFTADLTPTAADLNSSLKKGLFPSLVQTGGLKTQLASVSFDGTGAITDLAFTDVAPEFAADVADPEVTGVYVDGVEQDIGTLADAITAVNGASTSAAIKLNKTFAITEPLVFTANATITLDFAGFVLTNTQAYAAITNSATSLIITNSFGNGGIYCMNYAEEDREAVYNAVGKSLTIQDGSFWGNIAGNLDLVLITGGSFKQDAWDIGDCLADGMQLSDNEITGLNDVVPVPPDTWETRLGAPVEGAYQIGDETDLIALKDGVAAGLATAGVTFKLTDDIALTAAWEGIGIKGGKDLVNGSGKDIPAYEAGAFCGTFDGQNHTISNFQMENGTDYGGFFNSVNSATIRNLKITYKEGKLCADSSATGADTGATFVGVARGSTLQNLTALAGTVTTVSASKDMAGIVGYLMAGSTVDSCTNELNVASLLTAKARKSGGIALITQDGSGTATIRNCKNSGTVTLANDGGQLGGIVGYVGTSTTIVDCENTAAVKVLTVMNGAALTMQGTNKGNATVVSSNVATNGLNFATVEGNVATFVADNALALNGSYKVMAAGATATFEFAEAGTIAFDTALATPTYNITAPGLTLSDATSGTVTTYTAAEGSSWPQPSEDTPAAVDTALEADGFSTGTGVVTNKVEYDALIAYVTEKTSASSPEGLTAAQKANAVLCYALQASAIPTTEITKENITIDALATGDDGAVDLTVAIAGVTVGQSVPAATLAKIVTAKGGTALNAMSTENVTVNGHVVQTGKVKITVTPNADSPTSFFTTVIINK